MSIRHILLIILTAVITLSSCSKDNREVVIIYTTDIKGNFFPEDFEKNGYDESSVANLITFIKEQRRAIGSKMLLMDCGNLFSSGVENYYVDHVDTLNYPITYNIINGIKYDAIGVGALDLDNPAMTKPRFQDINLKETTICANLIDLSTGKPVFKPYEIFTRNGVRVAVLGMVSPSNNISLPGTSWRDFRTQDMIECAMQWMPEIQSKRPDIIIGLFHTTEDYEKDGFTADAYKNPNAGIPVAMFVPGFDAVLLGGDGKTSTRQMRANDGHTFTVVNAGSNCSNAGLVRIRLSRNGDVTNKRVTANVIELSTYEPDDDFNEMHASKASEIYEWLGTKIGFLTDTITGSDGIFGPTTYRSLLHRSQFWHTKADISICNAVIGSDTLLPGPITIQDLFRIYPLENRLLVLNMTGYEVKRYLEYGFGNQFETISSPDEDMLVYLRDKKGHIIYNENGQPYLKNSPESYSSATGIRYTVDISKPIGKRVHITSMADGRPFDLKDHYKVAINSDLASGGSNMITHGIGWNQETLDMRIIDISDISMRDIIKEYISNNDTISLQISGHWRIIPDQWWQKQSVRIQEEIQPVWQLNN